MAMENHIHTDRMARFCAKALPPQELASIAEHLALCRECHLQFQLALARQRRYRPATFSLAPEDWFRHDHLDFAWLVQYLDNRLDAEDLEITEIHLRTCPECREDVRVLRTYRQVTEPELKVTYGPTALAATERPAWLWPQVRSLWHRPAYSFLALLGMALVSTLGWLMLGRSPNEQALISPPVIPMTGPSQATNPPGVAPPGGKTISSPARATLTATPTDSLRATAQPPEINGAGQGTKAPTRSAKSSSAQSVKGLPSAQQAMAAPTGRGKSPQLSTTIPAASVSLPASLCRTVADTLARQRLDKPEVLAELVGDASGLRGAEPDNPPFRLLTPGRVVTAELRPVFGWEALPGASSYQVFVLDRRGQRVLSSPSLPATATSWQASVPLRRGDTYTWSVVAVADGHEVVAPAAATPEARFHVLSASWARELELLQKGRFTPLERGIIYARAGLVEEAEKELRQAVKDNKRARAARKLLRQVQEWRL